LDLVEHDHITPDYDPVEPEHSMPEADEWDAEAFDQYIAPEVRLPRNGKEILGQVVSRKRDQDGNPIGRGNSNPTMDTRIYQVVFPDGDTAEYSANVIAECIYSQVDNEGSTFSWIVSLITRKQVKQSMNLIFSKCHTMEIFIPGAPLKDGSSAYNGKTGQPHGRS
jgi:hypothetical protein